MEKLEIHKNTNQIKVQTELCQTAKNTVQSIWNEFNTLGLDLSAKTIFELINIPKFNGMKQESTKDSIKTAILDAQTEVPKIFGLAVSRDQLMRMVEIPNIETIVKLLHECENNLNQVEKYIVIENGNVQIIADFAEKIELKNTSFAEGEKQINRAKLLIKLRDDLNEYLKADFVSYGFDLPTIKGLNASGKEYIIDTSYITGY